MKFLKQIVVYFFAFLSVFIFAASIAGYFGHYNRYLEFTNNFKLQYLILSVCVLCFWLFIRNYYWLFLSSLCFVLNLAVIIPFCFPIQQQIINTQYESLKVLAFNVLHENTRYDDAINLVTDRRVDIAVFLEATPPWDSKLIALKKILPYHFSAKTLQIEIYSKYPLNNVRVELYGKNRGLVLSQLTVGKSNLIFVATHACPQFYFGREGWEFRNRHLKQGIGQLGKLEQPIVVAGDLNVTMWSPQYKSMIADSGLRNARYGFGILPTQSNYFPQFPWLAIPLDHFLVTEDILVNNLENSRNIGSDHLAIIMDALIPSNI